jgi:parallel beta-helix repeat protein
VGKFLFLEAARFTVALAHQQTLNSYSFRSIFSSVSPLALPRLKARLSREPAAILTELLWPKVSASMKRTTARAIGNLRWNDTKTPVVRRTRDDVFRYLTNALIITAMQTKFSFLAALQITLALLLGAPALFAQGPLNPPGAPAPTMKTLDQVEPRIPILGGTNSFMISASGSYYLTGNLSVASGNGIGIGANNVTIDLGGFELVGTGGSNGISVLGGQSNVTIRNGTIRNFVAKGIDGNGNSKVRVENVRAINNGNRGIQVDVNGAVIDCLAEGNGSHGISGASNCVIRNCQSIGNTGAASHGISVGSSAQISGCVTRNNGGAGIVAGTGSTLSDCVAGNNTSHGMDLLERCSVQNSSANENGINGGTTANSVGIKALLCCTVANCMASNNTGVGLLVNSFTGAEGSTVQNSVFNSNTNGGILVTRTGVISSCTASNNGGEGIHISNGTVLNCTARGNANVGIRAADVGNTVSNCTANANTFDGIRLDGQSTAIGNTCGFNDGAGIQVVGGGTRIEGNNVTGNDLGGIKIMGTRCLILRNSAWLNSVANYDIAADNRYGPILNITAAGSPAVLGSSAADTTATTHPWANFSY